MTPIESPYDIRFLTLVNVAMEALQELAVLKDEDPDKLLSDLLYTSTKTIHEKGEEIVANKLLNHYPMLNEAIA